MKQRRLSASSVKTYLQCLLKYHYRYNDKKVPNERSDALALGTAVHEALEAMYHLVSEQKKLPGPDVYAKVQKVFMDSATSNGLQDLSLYHFGKYLVTERLDNVTLEEKVIGLELSFDLQTPNGTPFTGSIDKLIELDPETAAVIDYKTSKVALTQQEADTDIQLSMYDLAVSMLYPQYKTVVLALDYLRLREVITYRTPEQRQLFVEFLDSIYEGMKHVKEEDIKPTLNMFCGWCSVRDFCPAFKSAVSDPQRLLPKLSTLSDAEFADAWADFSNVRRAVDSQYRDMKAQAYERLKNGVKKIKSDKFEIYASQSSRVSYDPQKVLKVAGPENFAKMASVSKTAVDKFVQNNPEVKKDMDKASSYAFNSPSFRHREVGPDENS